MNRRYKGDGVEAAMGSPLVKKRPSKAGFTAYGYGREKGNSQLAVMEELGLIGLGLYVALLATLLSYLAHTFQRIRMRDEKVAFGIVTGAIIGMIVSSVFEAWWVAPGSPEAPFFWGLIGIALGLGRVALQRQNVDGRRLTASLDKSGRRMSAQLSRR